MSATSPAAIGKKNGGWYKSAEEAVVVNGKWKAIPFGNVGQLMNWRTDWFAEVGVKDFPDTWDELLEAGTKLKKAGHPFGFELGHGFGDNHGWLYPLLWSYGGREVEPDGKTVVHRFRRDRPRRRLLPQVLPADDVRGLPGLDRSVTTTRRGWPSRSPAPTMPRASCGSPRSSSPTSAR